MNVPPQDQQLSKKKKKKNGKIDEELEKEKEKEKREEAKQKIAKGSQEIDDLFATAKKRRAEENKSSIEDDSNNDTKQEKKSSNKKRKQGSSYVQEYEPEEEAGLIPVDSDEEKANDSQEYGIIQSNYKRSRIINPEAPLERIDKETGLPVYKAHILKVGEGGGTPLCPFDCNCCF